MSFEKDNISHSIAVVIPCFRIGGGILGLISQIGPEVDRVFVVDDKCPHHTGKIVSEFCHDNRVNVIFNEKNLGVGGAVLRGYSAAIDAGADIIVKLDGDGQMNPALIPVFVAPILSKSADYTKGNRFFSPESLQGMPGIRIGGNAVLSFFNKLSTGYWGIYDPTNGFTAIHARVAECLPFNKISTRYFFESDMLFRLNCLGAVVVDVPMISVYGNEESGLKIKKIVPEFLAKHSLNLLKRIAYRYFVRDFNIASLQLIAGILLLLGGGCFGSYRWYLSAVHGILATSGVVMLAALPVFVGIEMIMSFINYDMAMLFRQPLNVNFSLWRTISKKLNENT